MLASKTKAIWEGRLDELIRAFRAIFLRPVTPTRLSTSLIEKYRFSHGLDILDDIRNTAMKWKILTSPSFIFHDAIR